MSICLLIRHGQSEANVEGTLAGHLDSALTAAGQDQADRLAAALSEVRLRRIVTSPLSRCRDTAERLAAAQPALGPVLVEEGLAEVRYGAWTGRRLSELQKDDLWSVIQSQPTAATFPASDLYAHESLAEMSARVWDAWQGWDAEITAGEGADAIWAVVSHGDVIKALLARCLGLHLDAFQSIVVDPASVSIVLREGQRTAVSGLNVRDDVFSRLAAGSVAADVHAEPATQDAPGPIGVVGGGNA